jgi:hypothetical protein
MRSTVAPERPARAVGAPTVDDWVSALRCANPARTPLRDAGFAPNIRS